VMQQRVGFAAPPDRHHQRVGHELRGHANADTFRCARCDNDDVEGDISGRFRIDVNR
jgi:hypothetical protein